MTMSYRKSKGKYVICKDHVYYAVDTEQLQELKALIADIESGDGKYLKEDARKN